MRLDRLPSNLAILNKLDILIRKFPMEEIEDLIEKYCFTNNYMIFYEESVETLERLNENIKELNEIKEGTPTEVNKEILKKLEKLVKFVPDQRFGQIYENYLLGMKNDKAGWLLWVESYVIPPANNVLRVESHVI